MKVIIAGTRTFTAPEWFAPELGPRNRERAMAAMQALVHSAVLASGFDVTEIVSGCGPGVDLIGESLCSVLEGKPNIKRFPAQWTVHGKSAGPIRNKEMAEYADALVIVWDGASRGSRNMLECAGNAEIGIFEVRIAHTRIH